MFSNGCVGPTLQGSHDLSGVSIDGWIDEATLYERPLTNTEIQDIHSAGSDGKCVI
jgi:hypothetical protein